jgi:hypothetical protein
MQRLKTAEPGVAQPTARQILGEARYIQTRECLALRFPFGHSGASPYHGFASDERSANEKASRQLLFKSLEESLYWGQNSPPKIV